MSERIPGYGLGYGAAKVQPITPEEAQEAPSLEGDIENVNKALTGIWEYKNSFRQVESKTLGPYPSLVVKVFEGAGWRVEHYTGDQREPADYYKFSRKVPI